LSGGQKIVRSTSVGFNSLTILLGLAVTVRKSAGMKADWRRKAGFADRILDIDICFWRLEASIKG
jgi:hypothetical protein